MVWKVNTPALIAEIGNNNPNMRMISSPLMIFSSILAEVGERASELNDPKLNALMCRLSIYAESDQYSPEYNKQLVKEILEKVGWE